MPCHQPVLQWQQYGEVVVLQARHHGPACSEGSRVLSHLVYAVCRPFRRRLRLLGRGLVSRAATTTARGYLLEHIPNLKID